MVAQNNNKRKFKQLLIESKSFLKLGYHKTKKTESQCNWRRKKQNLKLNLPGLTGCISCCGSKKQVST